MNRQAVTGIVAIIILAALVGNLDLVVKYLNKDFTTNAFKGLRGE